MAIEAAVQQIDEVALAGVVRRALGDPGAEIAGWRQEPVAYANVAPESRGLYRFSGTARCDGAVTPWSVVLKVFRAPQGDTTAAPTDEHYYRREVLAYRSGVLDDLPDGLAPPRHYGVIEWPGDTVGLWLEDIQAAENPCGPLADYGLAARHLGAFNGVHLADAGHKGFPWLSRRALATWIAGNAYTIDLIQRPDGWRHPLVRRAFPESLAADLLGLWSQHEALCAALERLPRTLCHHDASPTNLFSRRVGSGEVQTVAIDWELIGHGAVGEEIGNLVPVSIIDFHVGADEAARLEDEVFEGYLDGLRDAGWRGDPEPVRLAYAATAALRWAFPAAGWPIAIALDESGRHAPETEARWKRPLSEIFDQWAALASFLLDRAREARSLLIA